jgi:hypothetical protein
MAQTTDGMSMKNAMIELSDDGGSTWTDISGFANSLSVDGGEVATEGTATFNGDKKILTSGKKDLISIKVAVVYTEGAADAAQMAQDAYDAGTPVQLRWSPKGGGIGSKQFTSDEGVITTPVLPAGEADSAAAILCEFTIVTPGVTPSTVSA